MKIGQNTRNKMVESVRFLFEDYQKDIDEAYLQAGDEPLSISVSLKLSPDGGETKIETSISFTKEKVKDKITMNVNEDQQGLFDEQQGQK